MKTNKQTMHSDNHRTRKEGRKKKKKNRKSSIDFRDYVSFGIWLKSIIVYVLSLNEWSWEGGKGVHKQRRERNEQIINTIEWFDPFEMNNNHWNNAI